MSAFTALPGWTATVAICDTSESKLAFKTMSYPVIGWQADLSTTNPVTPIGVLNGGHVAIVSPDGRLFSKFQRDTDFLSVDAWLEAIKSAYENKS